MRSRQIWILVLFLLLVGFNLAVEKIELTNPVKFERKLARNNVFLKFCDFFDVENGFFYFLDRHFSVVFKVEQETGKLVKTISSRGQGPNELQTPVSFRVRNKKIFVLDKGFNGVKIFDTEGNTINEFKMDFVIGNRSIDVDYKEEIFLGRADRKNNSMVQVFDINGKKLRSLIPFKGVKDITKYEKSWYYTIRLDKDGSIYVLHYMDRKLQKYDKYGKLLWERPIKNKLLDQYPNDGEVKRGKGTVYVNQQRIFGINVTPAGNVIVAHAGGGCMFSTDGKLLNLVTTPNETWSLSQFKVFDDKLMNISAFGEYVYIYKFKED